MSNAVLSQPNQSRPQAPPGTRRVVATVLAAWFILIMLLGASGAFVTPPGSPPLRLLIGVTAPSSYFSPAIGSRAHSENLF